MITWWRIYPAYFFCIIPWIVAVIPNIPTKINVTGLYRQWLANHFMALLPDGKVFAYRQFFINGDFLDEFIAVIPMLITLTIAVMWCVYVVGTMTIYVNNAITKKTQKSIIDANR